MAYSTHNKDDGMTIHKEDLFCSTLLVRIDIPNNRKVDCKYLRLVMTILSPPCFPSPTDPVLPIVSIPGSLQDLKKSVQTFHTNVPVKLDPPKPSPFPVDQPREPYCVSFYRGRVGKSERDRGVHGTK